MPSSPYFFTRKRPPLDQPDVVIAARGPGWASFVISALAVLLILGTAWHLAGIMVKTTNQHLGSGVTVDPDTGKNLTDQDQKNNVNRALIARDFQKPDPALGTMDSFSRWFPHDSDGVVAPLWPWVASRFAEPDHLYSETTTTPQDLAFFERGKWVNITITLVFLWALGMLLARSWRPGAVVCVMLLGTFGALLPRAVYFQPEPLYYILFFLSWVLAIRLLIQNEPGLHAIFGIVAAFAYLAKTSVEPLVFAWFCAAGLRWLGAVCCRGECLDDARWKARNHFVGLIAFALGWGLVCAPLYSSNTEKFGNARHTWPSVWMWEDDFDTGIAFTNAHDTREKLEAVKPEDRPSLSRYRATHSPQEMQDRLWNGVVSKLDRFFFPKRVEMKKAELKGQRPFPGWKHIFHDRGWYLAGTGGLFLAAAVLLLTQRRRLAAHPATRLPAAGYFAGLFVIACTVGYTLAYGWYDPIGRGDRFMLSLYFPVIFSLIWAGENMVDTAISRRPGPWLDRTWHLLLWAGNAVLLWRIIEVLRYPVFLPGTA